MSIFTADGGPESEPGFENLGGYGDLVALGRRVGLLAEDELGRLLDEVACSLEEAGSAHARALELRGGIYELFRAIAEGKRPPSAAMDTCTGSRVRLSHAGGSCPARSDSTGTTAPTEATSRSAVGRGARGYPASDVEGSEPGEAVLQLLLALRRRQPQPEPALMHHGRLRHAREGPPLRREARHQARLGVASRTFGVVHPG